MHTNIFRRIAHFSAPAGALAIIALLAAPLPVVADGNHHHGHKQRYLKFDVAEIGSRFIPDEAPANANGFPTYGASFITQGLIYPHGFLDDNEGVDVDGNPTEPDKVIGSWTCYGFIITDLETTVTGPTVVSTQIYEFHDKPGKISFVSDGFELADFGKPVKRAITGGTGPFKTASGEIVQTLLAFPNLNEGGNLRFKVRLKYVPGGDDDDKDDDSD